MLKKLLCSLMVLLFFTTVAIASTISIKGSTTVLPIAQKLVENYMAIHPKTKISLSGGGSGNGIKAIIDGMADIANSSRFLKSKEVKFANDRGKYLVPFAIAYDSIVPIVHQSNPIKDISLEDLKKIYTGKYRNWKQLGGPDRPIVIISRDTSSGTYEIWHKKVMKKERVSPRALLQASNGAVVQAVSVNKNAIGYVGLGYLDSSVKGLTVEGIMASEETTLNNTYSISRPLFMFTSGWPKNEILDFINFVLHPNKGQKLVRESGYIPLY